MLLNCQAPVSSTPLFEATWALLLSPTVPKRVQGGADFWAGRHLERVGIFPLAFRGPPEFGRSVGARVGGGDGSVRKRSSDETVGSLGRRAWEAWMRAQDALRAGDLDRYGAEQTRIEDTLRAIIRGR